MVKAKDKRAIHKAIKTEKQTKYLGDPNSYMTQNPSWIFSGIDTECWTIHEKFFSNICKNYKTMKR